MNMEIAIILTLIVHIIIASIIFYAAMAGSNAIKNSKISDNVKSPLQGVIWLIGILLIILICISFLLKIGYY